MLIVTGTDRRDDEKGTNVHARQYQESVRNCCGITGLDPDDFRMEIATGVDSDGDPRPGIGEAGKGFSQLPTILGQFRSST